MELLRKIISQRSEPGVLILDLEDRLLYSNREAQEIICVLEGDSYQQKVPGEVFKLCSRLRGGVKGEGATCGTIWQREGGGESVTDYSLRAILLGSHGGPHGETHVMVLMEKVTKGRQIDFDRAREKFRLSRRETDVVRLLCQGLGNKEISGAIFVSEFTVKDHIKNILRKTGATTRNEIISILL